MNVLAAALLVALSTPLHPIYKEANGAVWLVDDTGVVGSGCPISPRQLITAKHVVLHPQIEGTLKLKLRGQDPIPLAGVVAANKKDLASALISPTSKVMFDRWYKVAKKESSPGDLLGWAYRFFHPNTFEEVRIPEVAPLKLHYNGNMIAGGVATPGTSGSCVLNEKGELVGILVGAWSDNRVGQLLGVVIVPIYGDLLPKELR